MKTAKNSVLSRLFGARPATSGQNAGYQVKPLRFESLEDRALLSVSFAEYAALQSAYPEFELPSQLEVNVIEIPSYRLSYDNLRSAIYEAARTEQDDLIVVRTTDDANQITYDWARELEFAFDSEYSGELTLVALGSRPLTLDAAQCSGVMTVAEGTTLEIGNLTLTGGDARNGGGIYNAGTLTAIDVTVAENDAYMSGGGIYNCGTLTAIDVTVAGNYAEDSGGGIYNGSDDFDWERYGTFHATNLLAFGNVADYAGGGIYVDHNHNFYDNYFETSSVTNATVAGNYAGSYGGGIYVNHELIATNVIASVNRGGNVDGWLVGSNCLFNVNPGFVVAPIFDADGNLTNADELDLRLRSDSPAVDAGWNGAVSVETDLDGKSRIYNRIVDIGAYEYQGDRDDEPVPYSSVVDTLNDSFDLNDGEWSLREAIFYATEYETITFAKNLRGTIALEKGRLEIYVPLAIDGANRITLDGGEKSGVLYVEAGTEETPVELKSLTITGGNGGGIRNVGELIATNLVVAGNRAYAGGGICNYGALTATNVTVAGNYAEEGGGICNYGALTATNVIVSANRGGNVYGSFSAASSHNLLDVNPGFVVAPIFDANGRLKNAAALDLRLRSDSLAVDAGTNAAVSVATDLDDKSRIYNGTVDIGAYEYQGDRNDKTIPYSSVVTTLNDSFDPNDGEWSLREAIYYATEYETIMFAKNLRGTLALKMGCVEIVVPLAIDGANRITLDGGGKNGVLYVFAGTEETPVELKGLTITGGNGGGIRNAGTLVATDLAVVGNDSYYGGGIHNEGAITATNLVVNDNSGVFGGGIHNAGTFTATNLIVNGNSGYYGGGICNAGIFEAINLVVAGNNATDEGGGINLGAGAYSSYDQTFTATNAVVAGNSAADEGGGFYGWSQGATLFNSIVALNQAETGDDFYCYYGDVDGYNVLSGFTAWTTSENTYAYDASKPLFAVNPIFDANGNLTNADALDLRLAVGSQALDKGNNEHVAGVETDLAGNARIQGAAVDLGAYEFAAAQALKTPTITKTEVGASGILVRWSKVANAASYEIRYQIVGKDGVQTASFPASKSAGLLTGIVPGATYKIELKAVAPKGKIDSEFSAPVEVQSAPLAAPTFTGGTPDAGLNGIRLQWNAVSAANGYKIQWRDAASTDAFSVKTVSAKTTAFQIVDLPENAAAYTVRIKSLGNADYADSAWRTVTVDAKTVARPKFTFTSASSTGIVVKWSRVYGASSYTIEYKLADSDGAFQTATVAKNESRFVVADVAPDALYLIRVKAEGQGAYNDSEASRIYVMSLETPDAATARLATPLVALDAAFADFGADDEDDEFWTPF